MASPKERRRQELARFLKIHQELGVPGNAGAAEQAMWVILRRHGTREGAGRAIAALERRFVDVNECRAARPSEIAEIIRRQVKNDPYRVASQLRGFLWRFHKDRHSMDLAVTEEMTNGELKKYLGDAEAYAPEMALALFCHYCIREQAEAKAEAEADDKAKPRRGEREVGAAVDRLRLLCSVAAYGTVTSVAKMATAHRHLVKAWTYSALPREEGAGASRTKTATRKKTSAARRTTQKKTTSKTTKKKATTKRGGSTTRPRTTRTSRARTTKKSSRR